MKSTSRQSLDQHADRSRSTVGNTTQRSSRRSSQPKFVLQPVVLDDTSPSAQHHQGPEAEVTEAEIEGETIVADPSQRVSVVTSDAAPNAGNRRGAREGVDRTRTTLLERRMSLPGRSAIIGALFICGVIAIALFVTLLLTGRAPIA